MGLDMYLNAKRFISEYRDADKQIAEQIRSISIPGLGKRLVNSIETEAMYWRKANAIHKWFVDNVQDGVDECQEHDVSVEDLQTLVALCKEVLANRENEERVLELMPPQDGFFFGSTEISDYFWEEVERTISELEALLSTEGIENWYFTYRSSW
jgi:DNA primase